MRPALPTLVAAAIFASAAGTAGAQIVETPQSRVIPKLTVRGEAELTRPADRLRLTIGVETEDAQVSKALQENTRRMNDVVRAIETAGLTRGEYETGRFRILPVHSRRPRQPEADWQPAIVGYQVVNTINLKTAKLELAGPLIEAANAAGANSIDNIGFDLQDERTHRGAAIAAATRHGAADASTLAEAAGVTLVRLLSITLDGAESAGRDLPLAMRGRAAAAEAGPPPITPGEVTITASVTLVYEIAPGGTPQPRTEAP
jgi:hypothetical protein